MRHASLSLAVVCLFACSIAAADFTIEPAFPNLKFTRPVFLAAPPDSAVDCVFIVEQDGRIVWFENRPDVTQRDVRVALDLTGHVRRKDGEEGLLGLAFDPAFAKTGDVYLFYTLSQPKRNVIARWTFTPRRDRIQPDSERILIEATQPYGNHNAGMIAFGPDGYLYAAFGDGGAGGDPKGTGQNKADLLASIIRIDVTDTPDGGYSVPPDNPFVNEPDTAPEIYAYGLRNVWRFSFDARTGDLWAGDVGQNSYEEIDLVTKGGNYGWNVREGLHPFKDSGGNAGPFVDPVLEYPRSDGVSVTGGYVYRGKAIPSLDGTYLYADFGSGRVWGLTYDGKIVTSNQQVGQAPTPSSFGVDRHGELYICSFSGRIYKFVPSH